ncbi:protein arginine N-methyltransferase 6-like [Asterias rubens]|uniref:protein arginine N-methyltransferase 6-like n=1 Tax=Asterias rubens TaxID=7604 RepID=UPI00145503DF|nr:protein arginine N-methyltransferase 6-like [Asterias rubens]XP_033648011.1 protein arginine N-methyltransferase 6-like [Asterias rubens]
MEPPVKRKRHDDDGFYFKSYSGVSIHEDMIRDSVRTNTYRLAILRCCEQIAGKVVADIGAGTGILSCFCVQAGAKKVYAIEASAIAEQAKKVVKSNKMGGKIQIVRGKVEEVELPEKVDVIVSEWMGHFLLYESMFNSVVYARDKWLKEDGVILPSQASLYMAPITNEEMYKERIDFWSDLKGKYGLDMECMIPYAKKCIFGSVQIEEVFGSDLIAHETKVATIDISKITVQELQSVKGSFDVRCFGASKFCGFVTWFTVTFDIPRKESVLLSTSPSKHSTHWRQSVLYSHDPVTVEQDTVIKGTITLTPGTKNSRYLDVALKYTVGEQSEVEDHYTMSDDGPS